MAKPPRTATSGTFFVTAITYNRHRTFQRTATAELFLETLQQYRHLGHLKLHAFVIMPDHIHLLPTTRDLPATMKLIKGGFSHTLASKIPVWQRGYTDHRVTGVNDFEVRRTYIHQNPIRANLAAQADLYPYSSAFAHHHS